MKQDIRNEDLHVLHSCLPHDRWASNLPKAISVAQGIFAFDTEKIAKRGVRDDATKCQSKVYVGHDVVIKSRKKRKMDHILTRGAQAKPNYT